MTDEWQLRVYEQKRLVCTLDLSGPVELGRQAMPDEKLYSPRQAAGRQRVAIAPKDERSASRQHLLIEPQPGGGFRITNLSGERPVGLPDGHDLKPNATCAVSTDALLTVGKQSVRLQAASSQRSPLQGLANVTLPPGQSLIRGASLSGLPLPPTGGEVKAMLDWLEATLDIFQSAASSADFFAKAAQAMVDLVNLDFGRVLLLKQDEWQIHAIYAAPRVGRGKPGEPSRHVLNRVRQETRTFREVPEPAQAAASLREIDAVVAAPILDRQGAVIGALYGERLHESGMVSAGPITELEAKLVEVFARGIAAGLARLELEQAALAARVQFEQFFTPELSRQLALQPDLLKGRDAEVSILFCDVRGFSRISEHLGPSRTVEWISDVMGALSDCVRAQAGVLVDYIGDELIAMWGAPEEQPDHAQLACRAALAMLEQLPKLNGRWQAVVKEPMSFGIGINTGMARVGNTGSRHKFKYGPLGNTVNLASRVQGATKYLKCKLLITGATQGKLDSSFPMRRLCQVRVVNIVEPVTLYELVPEGQAGWPAARVEYERALAEFENRNFSGAVRILGNWRAQQPDDAQALLLLYRAVQCMVEEAAAFDPVWILPGK